MILNKLVWGLIFMFAYFQLTNANPTNYNVGVGIADITGPAAQVDMVSVYIFFI